MLSLEETRRFIPDKSLSDEKVRAIRDALYSFAELALDSFEEISRNNFAVSAGFGQKEGISLPKTNKSNRRCHGKSKQG